MRILIASISTDWCNIHSIATTVQERLARELQIHTDLDVISALKVMPSRTWPKPLRWWFLQDLVRGYCGDQPIWRSLEAGGSECKCHSTGVKHFSSVGTLQELIRTLYRFYFLLLLLILWFFVLFLIAPRIVVNTMFQMTKMILCTIIFILT